MNENDWSALLEQGAERVPVAAVPVDSIVAGAARARRKRRRRQAGVTAVVVVATAGALAWNLGLPSGDDRSADRLTADAPAAGAIDPPPSGMRWAGLGRVAVAVPEEWGVNQTRCGEPQSDTVIVWDGPINMCGPARPAGVDSITITESPRSHSLPERAPASEIEIDGVKALRWAPRCSSEQTRGGPVCTVRVEFPREGVTILADSNRGTDAAEGLLDGLHILDAGVGIPDYAAWSSDLQERSGEEFARHLRERGFTVEVATERELDVEPGYLLGISPEPGTVVARGSTVTLTVVAGSEVDAGSSGHGDNGANQ